MYLLPSYSRLVAEVHNPICMYNLSHIKTLDHPRWWWDPLATVLCCIILLQEMVSSSSKIEKSLDIEPSFLTVTTASTTYYHLAKKFPDISCFFVQYSRLKIHTNLQAFKGVRINVGCNIYVCYFTFSFVFILSLFRNAENF